MPANNIIIDNNETLSLFAYLKQTQLALLEKLELIVAITNKLYLNFHLRNQIHGQLNPDNIFIEEKLNENQEKEFIITFAKPSDEIKNELYSTKKYDEPFGIPYYTSPTAIALKKVSVQNDMFAISMCVANILLFNRNNHYPRIEEQFILFIYRELEDAISNALVGELTLFPKIKEALVQHFECVLSDAKIQKLINEISAYKKYEHGIENFINTVEAHVNDSLQKAELNILSNTNQSFLVRRVLSSIASTLRFEYQSKLKWYEHNYYEIPAYTNWVLTKLEPILVPNPILQPIYTVVFNSAHNIARDMNSWDSELPFSHALAPNAAELLCAAKMAKTSLRNEENNQITEIENYTDAFEPSDAKLTPNQNEHFSDDSFFNEEISQKEKNTVSGNNRIFFGNISFGDNSDRPLPNNLSKITNITLFDKEPAPSTNEVSRKNQYHYNDDTIQSYLEEPSCLNSCFDNANGFFNNKKSNLAMKATVLGAISAGLLVALWQTTPLVLASGATMGPAGLVVAAIAITALSLALAAATHVGMLIAECASPRENQLLNLSIN